MLIKIAWRNIWRNTSRSLVILAAIVMGLTGGNFVSSIFMGLTQQNFRDTIEQRVSHIQLHDPAFVADRDARFRIADGRRIAEEIHENPAVKAVAARTLIEGMAASPHLSSGVQITGIDRVMEMKTTGFHDLIAEGTYFTERGRLPSAVVGGELAEKLRVGVGSRIVLTFMDVDGDMISASFRIEGVYAASSRVYEARTVFVRAEDLNPFIGDPEAVTDIAVLLREHERYQQATSDLQEAYPHLSVRNWETLAPDVYFRIGIMEQGLLWLIGILLLGVGFGILNTVLMSVFERTREIGMLMSIGMKKIRVFSMVIVETVLLSVTGGGVGLLLSFGLVRLLNRRGMDLSAIGGENLREFGFSPVIHPDLSTTFYVNVAVLVVFFAVAAAVYPAYKSIRLVPAEAVRKE